MYSRRAGAGERTFGVSGKLWHGVLVMFDRETGSLWTQLDGRAIQGAELGATLAHVPSTFTTWAAWRAAHPDTLVLEKDEEARAQESSHYAEYFADPERLFLDRLGEGLGTVIGAKETVYGVLVDGRPVAVPEATMAEYDRFAFESLGQDVVLLRDPTTGGVTATVNGRPVRVDRAYWYAWKRTHPTSLAVR